MMKFTREQINVTGSATKEIRSDYIIWTGTFTRRAGDLKTAYKLLEGDLDKVKNYLAAKGVEEKDVIVSQATTDTIYRKNEKGNNTYDIHGYGLSQWVEIRSNDVD